MRKTWDYIMRRKPLFVTFALFFSLSVILGHQLLARSNVSEIAPQTPTADETSRPVLDQPSEMDSPVDMPLDNVPADDFISDPSFELTGQPEIPAESDFSPVEPEPSIEPELTQPEITQASNYFVLAASPRDVALLNNIAVPRTGMESSAPAVGVAAGNDSMGVGANLADELTSDQDFDHTFATTMPLLEEPTSPSRSGFIIAFFVTLAVGSLLLAVFLRWTKTN